MATIQIQRGGVWVEVGSLAEARALMTGAPNLPKTVQVAKTAETVECPRCHGTGKFVGASRGPRGGTWEGDCFACKGGGVYAPGWKTGGQFGPRPQGATKQVELPAFTEVMVNLSEFTDEYVDFMHAAEAREAEAGDLDGGYEYDADGWAC
jgi:DnaJ-class molecular chaperone